jgi:hypothetical protein
VDNGNPLLEDTIIDVLQVRRDTIYLLPLHRP